MTKVMGTFCKLSTPRTTNILICAHVEGIKRSKKYWKNSNLHLGNC